MRILGPVTEDEVIGCFLRAELTSKRYGQKLRSLLARDGVATDVLRARTTAIPRRPIQASTARRGPRLRAAERPLPGLAEARRLVSRSARAGGGARDQRLNAYALSPRVPAGRAGDLPRHRGGHGCLVRALTLGRGRRGGGLCSPPHTAVGIDTSRRKSSWRAKRAGLSAEASGESARARPACRASPGR
jgi:hypothetical protein